MGKTPEYTKKAIENYRSKFDIVQVRLPKGMKDRLSKKGKLSDYIVELIVKDLENDGEKMM